MGLFQHLEGEAAVIVQKGVYKQVDLYTRDGHLYAKTSGGFVRINMDGSTTQPTVRVDVLDIAAPLYRDSMGRVLIEERPGAQLLGDTHKKLLLGAPA